MSPEAPPPRDADPIMARLEEQIDWYDRKSLVNQRYFRRIKMIEIVAAAFIPFLTAFDRPEARWATGGLGMVITVLEGMLHLNQYQQNWVANVEFCESLKHEKYTYLKVSPYADVQNLTSC